MMEGLFQSPSLKTFTTWGLYLYDDTDYMAAFGPGPVQLHNLTLDACYLKLGGLKFVLDRCGGLKHLRVGPTATLYTIGITSWPSSERTLSAFENTAT